MNTSLWQEQIKVKVYIRNYKKNAICMTIDAPITSRELKDKIENKFRQQIPECALFYKGRRIEDNETLIPLEPSAIIHIVDLSRTTLSELNLIFRVRKHLQEPNHPDNISVNAKVRSDAYIRDVIENQIKNATGKGELDVFLVYLGRPLNIFKKFHEELVQNESEILVIDFKREERIDHTRIERIASNRQTAVNYAPGLSHRTLEDYQNLQESITTNLINKNSQKLTIAPSQKIGGSTVFSKNKNKFQSAGPLPFSEFKPISQTDPGQKYRKPGEKVIYQKLEEIDSNTAPPENPEKGGPLLKADDLLFSGDPQMEETENVFGGAVQQLKENFMKKKKKKSSSSSQHSKG